MSCPHPFPEDFAEPLAERFRLLSEPTRLRLLDQLRDGERTVGVLADGLGCTQANASKHLSMLADGGLLERRKDGLHCYYRIADPSVYELFDAVCEGLRRHYEARAGALRPPAA